MIETFEGGALANYRSVLHYLPAADISTVAGHDGLRGLAKSDGFEWLIRNDSSAIVSQGQTFSVWVRFTDTADGRAYFGFGAIPQSFTQSTGSGRTLSLVLAANTNQLILQNNTGYGHTQLGAVSLSSSVVADQWYRMEVSWGAGTGNLIGRLYGSDGTTLLDTVTGTHPVGYPTSGGIAFRAFGGRKDFDTVVVDTDSSASVSERASAGGGLDPTYLAGTLPAGRANGPSNGYAPVPWEYTSFPGTSRDVILAAFNQLQQFANQNGFVALAASNTSLINSATTNGIDWGSAFGQGAPATPLLAQYIFRQRPGEQTTLIGASDVKHFFAPSVLNPGQTDAYGSSLNASQFYFTPGSEVDPVTGVLHRPSHVSTGGVNNDGWNIPNSHSHQPLDHRLVVRIADLDPAQNPVGTRWFLMGNIFVEGDQNVANNSRWVEITPSWNGTTFSFTYPSGSGGQLDFRTIPGLQEPTLGVRTIDNTVATGTGFSATSGFLPFSGQGYQNDVHYAEAGTGTQTATWTFTGLASGQYRVAVTWTGDANRANNAPFSVNGGAPIPVNQRLDPSSFRFANALWHDLGTFTVTGDTLTVQLSDNTSTGYVIADGVRIEQVVQIIDDGAAGFSTFGGQAFTSFSGQGHQGDVTFAAAGTGTNLAAWTFIVAPGTYRVSATWTADPNRATNAAYTIYDNLAGVGAVSINQQLAPSGFTADGATWQVLGDFTITGNQLLVLLSDLADGYVIADAVRIERLA